MGGIRTSESRNHARNDVECIGTSLILSPQENGEKKKGRRESECDDCRPLVDEKTEGGHLSQSGTQHRGAGNAGVVKGVTAMGTGVRRWIQGGYLPKVIGCRKIGQNG